MRGAEDQAGTVAGTLVNSLIALSSSRNRSGFKKNRDSCFRTSSAARLFEEFRRIGPAWVRRFLMKTEPKDFMLIQSSLKLRIEQISGAFEQVVEARRTR